MKIFISCVSDEFQHCRDALAKDLRAIQHEVLVQDEFLQSPSGSLLEKLQGRIAECDRIIFLIGDTYGLEAEGDSVPPDRQGHSLVQWEYFFTAGERLDGSRVAPKDFHVYFSTADFGQTSRIDAPPREDERQHSFRLEVKRSGRECSEFTSIHELRSLVLRDCSQPNSWPYYGANSHTITELQTPAIWAYAFTRDGTRVLAGLERGSVALWELPSRKLLRPIDAHPKSGVLAVQLSTDEKWGVSGDKDGVVRLFDLENEAIHTLEGHSAAVLSVDFSPNGQFIVSGSKDKTAKVWDVQSGLCIGTYAEHWDSVNSVAWNPIHGEDTILSASSDFTCHVWHSKIQVRTHKSELHTKEVLTARWSPNGKAAISASRDETICVWNPHTRNVVRLVGKKWIRAVAWDPHGEYAVSGADDGSVRIWNLVDPVNNNSLVLYPGDPQHPEPSTRNIHGVFWSAGGQILAGDNSGFIRSWPVERHRLFPITASPYR